MMTSVRTEEGGRGAKPTATSVDWSRWMRGLGRHTRRMREFLGLSQEQLARGAGVSQGAVSRLESGRGLATPLLVLLKINLALKREMEKLDPELLSDEARTLRNMDDRIAPPSEGGGFRDITVMKDPALEQLILIYRSVPERQRERLLAVMTAVGKALG